MTINVTRVKMVKSYYFVAKLYFATKGILRCLRAGLRVYPGQIRALDISTTVFDRTQLSRTVREYAPILRWPALKIFSLSVFE